MLSIRLHKNSRHLHFGSPAVSPSSYFTKYVLFYVLFLIKSLDLTCVCLLFVIVIDACKKEVAGIV